MPLPLLAIVRMKDDHHRSEGIEPGAVGVIVDVYGNDDYEVEFSDPAGMTIALLTLHRDEIEGVVESAVLAAPRPAD